MKNTTSDFDKCLVIKPFQEYQHFLNVLTVRDLVFITEPLIIQNTMLCKMCRGNIKGRSDKIYCSIDCKNEYHIKLIQVTKKETLGTDTILHRNRSILLEVMGKNLKQKKVDRSLLDKKKFNFNYVTGYYLNSKNKMYNYVYDFSWMIFSDREVLILRRSVSGKK